MRKKVSVNTLGRGVLFGLLVVVVFFSGLVVSFFSFGKYIVDASSGMGSAVLGESAQSEADAVVDLPTSFPNNFPVYPGSLLVDKWEVDTMGVRGISVVWVSNHKMNEVFEFFKNKLVEQGWKIETPVAQEQKYIIAFEIEKNFGKEVCITEGTCNVSGFINIEEGEQNSININVTMGVKTNQ